MALERLQKIISRQGLGSRREAEDWIKQGLVTVNGVVAKLGDKADLEIDAIKVRGKRIPKVLSGRSYYLFYKPKGVISSLDDPEGRPTIRSYISKIKEKVYPVGNLEFNTDGLVLLTNDGDLAEKIQKSTQIPRMYHVKVRGHPDIAELDKLKRGGRLQGRVISPYSVRVAKRLENKMIIEIVLIGTGAPDLKTFFEHKGFLVERITRVSIGHLRLKNIKAGKYVRIEKSQVEALLNQPNLLLREIEFQEKKEAEKIQRRAKAQTERSTKNNHSSSKKTFTRTNSKSASKSKLGSGYGVVRSSLKRKSIDEK
jgi:23S rRNA pseudouridine2605 synthase